MDKKRSVQNILTGIISQVFILVFNLITRIFLIKYVGIEALGLTNLFISVLSIVSIVELGISGIIPFSMYKAIIDNDRRKVTALYCFFSRFFKMIFLIYLIVGLSLTPLIPFLSKNYTLNYNIYILYIIFVFCSSLSYTYTNRSCLIIAYKKNYIRNIIYSLGLIIKYGLQVLFLFLVENLYVYISLFVSTELFAFLVFYLYTFKYHKEVVNSKALLDSDEKRDIYKLIKSSFLHKFGVIFVYLIEGLLISSFIGVDVLGKYSNYALVITALTSIAESFFVQLASIIGYAYYENDQEKFKKYFNFFYLFNYFISSFIFFCYFKCIPSFISLFFLGNEISSDIIIFLTINRFTSFMLHSVRLFKNNTGIFVYDSWKCIPEAILNVTLSFVFVHFIGIRGILLAKIITDLFICDTIEPYVLYKHIFKSKPVKYYIFNYLLIGVFVALLFGLNYSLNINTSYLILDFILSGLYATIFSIPAFILLFVYTQKTYGIKNIVHQIRSLNKNG